MAKSHGPVRKITQMQEIIVDMQEILDNAIAIRFGSKWYRGIIPGTARQVADKWVTFEIEWAGAGGRIKRFTFPLDQITGIESE